MKIKILLLIFAIFFIATLSRGQDYAISTVFNSKGVQASGAYGAISNKFSSINGNFANLVEVYGGWYVNHKFLLGLGAAATTNNIPVAEEHSVLPGTRMSYEYGQFGLMTDYVIGSHRTIHVAFQLLSGAGFTVQYQRYNWQEEYRWQEHEDYNYDENFFFVAEPGVKVEMNLFKWMRFSPGVSYRAAFGSNAKGLSDDDLSAMSVNLTLKFGKF